MSCKLELKLVSREPNFFEKYYIVRSINGFYTNFNVTAKYNQPLLKTNLSNALQNLIANNNSLSSNFYRTNSDDLKEDGANFVLKPVDIIRFDDVVAIKDLALGAINSAILRELDDLVVPMDIPNAPLWKLILWQAKREGDTLDQYLSFYCDHTLYDGNSGVFFHEKLLAELAQLKPDCELEYQDILFEKSASSTVPPFNKAGLDVYAVSTPFFLSAAVSKLFMPDVVLRVVNRWLAWLDPEHYVDKSVNPRFQYKPTRKGTPSYHKLIHFSPAQVTAMRDGCRSHGVTLSPYIVLCGLQCLGETLFQKVSPPGTVFSGSVAIPINNRRYIDKVHARDFGCLISSAEIDVKPLDGVRGEEFWDIVKRVSKILNEKVELREPSKMVGMLKYVRGLDFLNSKVGSHNKDTVEISNLGNNNCQAGAWEIEDFVFSQSNGVNPHFGLSAVSTLKGGMNISFGYPEDYLEFDTELEQFVDLFKKRCVDVNQ